MPNPEPVPQMVVCSVCGEDWEFHKKEKGRVTKDECIRILRAELAKRPLWSYTSGAQIGGSGSLTDLSRGVVAINSTSKTA